MARIPQTVPAFVIVSGSAAWRQIGARPARPGVPGELEPVVGGKPAGGTINLLRAQCTRPKWTSARALIEGDSVAQSVRHSVAPVAGPDGDEVSNRAGRLRIPTRGRLPGFGAKGHGLKRIRVWEACQTDRRDERDKADREWVSSIHLCSHDSRFSKHQPPTRNRERSSRSDRCGRAYRLPIPVRPVEKTSPIAPGALRRRRYFRPCTATI